MRALVYFEVLGASEDLAAAGERARERLLARVHADVVHQLVLGLEGLSVPRAALPEAGVVGLLGAADVLHRQVRHDLVHRREEFAAGFARLRRVLVYPHARVFLFDGRPHVAEEGSRAVRVVHAHAVHTIRPVRVVVVVLEVVRRGVETVVPGWRGHLVEAVVVRVAGAAVHVSGSGDGEARRGRVHASVPRRRVVLEPRQQHLARHRVRVVRRGVQRRRARDAEHRGVVRRGVRDAHVLSRPQQEIARGVGSGVVRVHVAVLRGGGVVLRVGGGAGRGVAHMRRRQLERGPGVVRQVPRRAVHERIQHHLAASDVAT